MAFYDLKKEDRVVLVSEMNAEILNELKLNKSIKIYSYFSDEDTYIRKTAYLAIGKIYKREEKLQMGILKLLDKLFLSQNEKVRQTSINAAGEIGIIDFAVIESLMDKGLFDKHHSVRNAVIGSVKKMGEKNPKPVLKFAKRYLRHEDKEIRREICHGIELRGRKFPQDILPLLKQLQNDKTARVRNTLVHVLGQIAYKKDCLETVVADLKRWENKELVTEAIDEIIDVHKRYKNFSVKTQKEAISYISKYF
ncbi:MAG TPA: HEAT repeat domain-containing protein [Bacteroidia bacterium]|jgi:HEAT repeat protein|nr:HEAT repeat domain-containing protein [Bacteroidia bacterium]